MNVYMPRTLTLFDTNALWAHLLLVVRCTMVLFEGVAHFPRRRVGLCSNSLADGVQGMALIGDRIPDDMVAKFRHGGFVQTSENTACFSIASQL